MSTLDAEILLATTAKIMTKGYTWSDFKNYNTIQPITLFRNTTITLSKVDTRRTSFFFYNINFTRHKSRIKNL